MTRFSSLLSLAGAEKLWLPVTTTGFFDSGSITSTFECTIAWPICDRKSRRVTSPIHGPSAGGDADFSSSHCCRYNAATPVWSMSSALLIWVHNPVVLQLVLPVQSARGPPVSDRTTNLLWPSPLDLSSRSIVGTPLSFK